MRILARRTSQRCQKTIWSSSYDLFAIPVRCLKLMFRSSSREVSQTSLRNVGDLGSKALIKQFLKYVLCTLVYARALVYMESFNTFMLSCASLESWSYDIFVLTLLSKCSLHGQDYLRSRCVCKCIHLILVSYTCFDRGSVARSRSFSSTASQTSGVDKRLVALCVAGGAFAAW